MDKSVQFFGKLEDYEARIKKELTTKGRGLSLDKAVAEKKHYVIEGLRTAMEIEGYSLIVDDIANYLDVDEKYVRANILPQLDYIVAPDGASEAFSPAINTTMDFLEMRIKKWKKVFIQKESFEIFLSKNLFIYCPYTPIEWNERKGGYVGRGREEIEVPYETGMKLTLIRKCNIAELIKERKKLDLVRKTKNDITRARQLELIDAERLKIEMELLMKNSLKVSIPVHNQEIKKYIDRHLYYRLHLYKDKEKDIRPTVLYYFV